MPPVPSSDEGIEVVVVPIDHGSLEGYHCCCPVKSINPSVGDVYLFHVNKDF